MTRPFTPGKGTLIGTPDNLSSSGPPCLYSRLLGPDWLALSPRVRRGHSQGAEVRGTGHFEIIHGQGRLSRLAVRVLRMPQQANAVPTLLSITIDGMGESWNRSFGDRRMTTRQFDAGGVLAEQFGPLELHFRLRTAEGALVYVQASSYFVLGALRLRIPKWLAPRVCATEQPRNEKSHVSVQIDLPLIGRLISYEGLLTIEDP
jgi:hypothetical protein